MAIPKKGKISAPRAGITFDPVFNPNIEYVWRPVKCANFDWVPVLDADGQPVLNADGTPQQQKEFHHFSGKPCACRWGPQYRALLSDADEVACGGGRGSAKSEALLAFFAKGSETEKVRMDPTKPWSATYLNHPGYRFLCLRKNATDLRDFFDRAKRFFAPLQGVPSDNTIKFPSGAVGVFDHMADKDAFEKYQGQQFTRVGIEELGQIDSESLYEKIVIGSVRSKYPELKPQIMVTFNPGGRGSGWINRRFVKMKTNLGNVVPWGKKWTNLLTRRSRVFIFSTVDDNPYYLLDEKYVQALDSINDPILRRQWRQGDFDAMVGQYFPDFRERHMLGTTEPPEACHVVSALNTELKPWWHRWIALDWGYQHASVIYWGCQHPNGQIHVYRERAQANVTPDELGEILALATMPDLEGLESKRITLFVPPEFIDRKNFEQSNARQLMYGIERVLGAGAAVIMGLGEGEGERDTAQWDSRLKFQQSAGISIRSAFNKRVEGWQYMRGLMRFMPLPSEKPFATDFAYAAKLIADSKFEAYNAYMAQANKQKPAILPRMLIHDCCKLLIEAIPTAVFCDSDSTSPEDLVKTATNFDDALDASRYLLASHRYLQNEEPYEDFRERRLGEVLQKHPWVADSANALVAVNLKAEEDYDMQRGSRGAITLGRPWARSWRDADVPDEHEPHPLHLIQ